MSGKAALMPSPRMHEWPLDNGIPLQGAPGRQLRQTCVIIQAPGHRAPSHGLRSLPPQVTDEGLFRLEAKRVNCGCDTSGSRAEAKGEREEKGKAGSDAKTGVQVSLVWENGRWGPNGDPEFTHSLFTKALHLPFPLPHLTCCCQLGAETEQLLGSSYCWIQDTWAIIYILENEIVHMTHGIMTVITRLLRAECLHLLSSVEGPFPQALQLNWKAGIIPIYIRRN